MVNGRKQAGGNKRVKKGNLKPEAEVNPFSLPPPRGQLPITGYFWTFIDPPASGTTTLTHVTDPTRTHTQNGRAQNSTSGGSTDQTNVNPFALPPPSGQSCITDFLRGFTSLPSSSSGQPNRTGSAVAWTNRG